MAHRMPEGGRRLAGKRAPRTIGDGPRDHQRQAGAALGELLEAGEDRRLGVEGVENGLDEDEVGAAIDEPLDLLAIGDAELIEADRAEARIVDVRRQRRGAVRRPQRAGDEAAPSVRFFRLDRRPPRQSRPVAIELVDDIPAFRSRLERSRSRRRCWSRGYRRPPSHKRNGCLRSPAAGSGSEDHCCPAGRGRRRESASPRKSVSPRLRHWIWVPIAPSISRIRSLAARLRADSGSSRRRERRVDGWIEVTIHSADRQCRYCDVT